MFEQIYPDEENRHCHFFTKPSKPILSFILRI